MEELKHSEKKRKRLEDWQCKESLLQSGKVFVNSNEGFSGFAVSEGV